MRGLARRGGVRREGMEKWRRNMERREGDGVRGKGEGGTGKRIYMGAKREKVDAEDYEEGGKEKGRKKRHWGANVGSTVGRRGEGRRVDTGEKREGEVLELGDEVKGR